MRVRLRVHALRPRAVHTRAVSAPFPPRSHSCGALSPAHVGERVVLAGWLLPERKLSNALSFFPLKDSFGTTQLVLSRPSGDTALAALSDVPVESAVLVQGEVRLRPQKQRRPEPAGDIEVLVDDFTLLNPAARDLPFVPSDTHNLPNEDLRAQYRYLDLRRSALAANIHKRSRVAHLVRTVLHDHAFLEVETPILLKSTPEGAREFLVPTRHTASPSASESDSASADPTPSPTQQPPHPQPLFYALPQSPQQPKQLLICSGAVDRYYQLARCFRDEDGRRDRQPEFTQVDLEMAFVPWGPRPDELARGWRIGGGDVRDVVEALVTRIWADLEHVQLQDAFTVVRYADAMARYGSDKPDTRFGLEITDARAPLPPGARAALGASRATLDCLVVRSGSAPDAAFARAARECALEPSTERVEVTQANADALAWLRESRTVRELAAAGEGARANDREDIAHDGQSLDVSPGDVVYLATRRDPPEGGSTALGRQRLRIAELAQSRGEYAPPAAPHFLWVTEFPLFTRADEDKDALARGRWSSSHHPFTAPMWEDVRALYEGRVDEVRGQHYDLVLNGVEIGGGSVRVHDAAMQEHIFKRVLQLDERETASFGHLLHALKCGAPPHGGIALGFDRLMAVLCKTASIRDVIAFPKTGAGADALFRSPAPVAADVLAQYGIAPASAARGR